MENKIKCEVKNCVYHTTQNHCTADCITVGVKNVLVEQDNAIKCDDPFGVMRLSYDHLRKII